jgi:hypothetical protein
LNQRQQSVTRLIVERDAVRDYLLKIASVEETRLAIGRRNCAPDCALTSVYARQTQSLTGKHRETSIRSQVVETAGEKVLRYDSISVERLAFQACSIDHSDISPFRIKHLPTRDRRESYLCPDCALTLSAFPTHFNRRWAITGLFRRAAAWSPLEKGSARAAAGAGLEEVNRAAIETCRGTTRPSETPPDATPSVSWKGCLETILDEGQRVPEIDLHRAQGGHPPAVDGRTVHPDWFRQRSAGAAARRFARRPLRLHALAQVRAPRKAAAEVASLNDEPESLVGFSTRIVPC